jgi:hypothetical protein
MRGDIVHSVFGVHEGREKDVNFGTFRTIAEAEQKIEQLRTMEGGHWGQSHHNKGFVIRPVVVETDFRILDLPKPRDKFFVSDTVKPNRPGTWDTSMVKVFRRGATASDLEPVCGFDRNYRLLQTFEPFRQGRREFALISRDYTKTAVLDLGSGQIIAEEAEQKNGFCPVGFYVPDWWDVNDGSEIPGSQFWDEDEEWPIGTLGFVWGCLWGDDSSWKVQCLDLSKIQQGVITRDERFGYVELATSGYRSACLEPLPATPGTRSAPPPFISVTRDQGRTSVMFAVEMRFDGDSGACLDWKRTGDPFR